MANGTLEIVLFRFILVEYISPVIQIDSTIGRRLCLALRTPVLTVLTVLVRHNPMAMRHTREREGRERKKKVSEAFA